MELTESLLSLIAQSNPGAYAIYRVDGGKMTALFRADSLPAISGMTPEEYAACTQDDAAAIILPADRAQVAALLAALLTDGKDADFTYRILHRTQGSVWVHATARLLGTLNGVPVLIVVFGSTTYEAEEHAFLLSHSADSVYVVDRESRELLYANEPALRVWGKGDYSGLRCYEYVHGASQPCPWCSIPKMHHGETHQNACYDPTCDRWFSIDCIEMRWHGRPAVAVYGADITERIRRQQSLELDKKSLDTIINNIPVGVGVCELQGETIRSTSVNPQLTEMLGMTADAFAAPRADTLAHVHPDDRAQLLENVQKGRRAGARIRFDFRFRRTLPEAYRWYHVEASTLKTADGATVFVCITDTTAEKQALEDRRNARRMYEAAVEEAQLVVWQYDLIHHRVTMADNEFTQYDYRKFGLPKVTENAPEALVPYIAEADQEKFLAMYRAVAAGEPKASCEVWYKLRPGHEPRCEHLSYTTIFDEDGRPVGAYGIGQNITARRREEENYRLLNRQLSESITGSVGSAHLDLTGNRCISVQSTYSDAAKRQPSATADGFLRAVSLDILDEDARTRYLDTFRCAALLRLYQNGTKRVSCDYPVLFQDKSLHWIRCSLTMLQNPFSGAVEAVAYATDITPQKTNADIIEHLTNRKFDYVALLDLNSGTIELCNRQASITFGKLHEKADYEQWRQYIEDNFIAPGEDQKAYFAGTGLAQIAAELQAHGEYTFVFRQRADGRDTRRQLQYSWLNRARGEVLLVRSDITATYEQEQAQLRRTQDALRQAEEANRAKTEFVFRISHDIRTPISIIKSMTAFAMADLQDPDRLQDDLRKIEASNTFLLSLINDVLDISRIDSGKIELNPQPYAYADYFSNICNMFEPLCRQKGLTFRIGEKHTIGTILVDHIRLNQITLNLLSNAVKYTPAGGTVTFSASSTPAENGRLACEIRVQDTGIGMGPEFQKIMFEPFSQEFDNPQHPKAGSGTGLGLSIVKRLVDLLGGTIELHSARGCGTDVRVRFMADAAPAGLPAAGADSAADKAAQQPLSGRVLLAEDNAINVQITSRILHTLGVEADTAEDGGRAVALFRQSAPGAYRAILMDIQMPLVNGYEATEQIRALARPDAKTIPIIAMTADAFSAAEERSRAAGMNGYLTKPLEPALLEQTLRNAFAARLGGAGAGGRG